MGIFSWFRRKKQVVELPHDAKQWNKMWDMWVEGEIESPYYELMEYLNGVNNGGHCCHFDNIMGNDDLGEYVKNLESILPEPLKSNVTRAYNAFMVNPDDISDENNDILDECDKVYYDHEELVNAILKDKASTIDVE